MKKILVATDFSGAAYNAANYAADMALAINAGLLLLHVYQIPVSYGEIPALINTDAMRVESEKFIGEQKEQLLHRSNNKLVVDTELRLGNFFQELKAVSESIRPYVVVMGSQGKSATELMLFGGHAVHAMKQLQWPLITVPPNVVFSSIKNIGMACDFDKVVDTTPVDEIKMLVHDFNAKLHVLNTGKETVFDPNVVFESGLLQELLEELKPEYHFITNGNIDEGIMEFAEKNGIDLLVVLPKRHGLLEKLIHKSHTKELVLHSHVPVMALHQ